MNNELHSAFLNLHSNEFQKRSMAIETLMNARDPYVLKDISNQIKENPNEDFVIIIIGLCEEILNEDDTNISYLAITLLNFILHNSTQLLASKAEDTLVSYFKNTNIIDGHKALNISKSWKYIQPNHRYFIVEIIQNFKYHMLVNLLLDNFRENDSKLIVKSIHALNKLKETRGNRFLRECLKSKNLNIKYAAIMALGNTGLYWDAMIIQKYLKSPELTIRAVSIQALRKLLGKRSLNIFKKTFHDQPIEIKKIILEETTSLRIPKALFFLLDLLNRSDMSQLFNTIEWSIYNIQTKKKIGTIINFFPNASSKTKYKIVNLLGDFIDDKCYKHFLSLLKSQENVMTKSLAAHHLTHYNNKITKMALLNIMNSTNDRVLKYSTIKSLLNMSHDIAKETIEKLLLNQEDLNDEIIMLICKNLKNQKRVFENDIYSMFIFEILQTGTNDTILSILSILPNQHNFDVFKLLIELYHDPDYLRLKSHIALTQLHILIDFPYYLSVQILDEDISDLINMINPYKANYQIILHLIRLDVLANTDIIHKYIQKNKDALSIKLNYIINKNKLSIEDLNMVLDYLFSENLKIDQDNFQFIIDNYFDSFSSDNKMIFMNQLITSQTKNHYSFIIDQFYQLEEKPKQLQIKFKTYLRDAL